MTWTKEHTETESHGDACPLLPPSLNSASAVKYVEHVPLPRSDLDNTPASVPLTPVW